MIDFQLYCKANIEKKLRLLKQLLNVLDNELRFDFPNKGNYCLQVV